MRPVEESFTEEWVRETLALGLPDGIVAHRAPEVLRSVREAKPTFDSIRDAFWTPLQLFVRVHTPAHEEIRDRLVERLEETFAEDDRPYVSEWLAAQGDIRWLWKQRDYWKGLLKRADRESRLPNHRQIGDYTRPSSKRTRDATWWFSLRKYTDEWRLPDNVAVAYTGFKKPSDWVRMIRYIERNTQGSGTFPRLIKGDLDVRYGKRVGKILNERIRLMTKDLDFVDNIRVAARDNPAEMSHYRWQRSRGCCGSKDVQIDVEGRAFMIGCNYGH